MAKRIVISDESVNCYGTWVKTEGVDISQYEKNPVLLWMHWRGIIIGCIKDVRKEGDKITGEPYFDEVRDEMASAHFEVLETSDAAELIKPGQYRATAIRSKLIETSMVDIGGNDNALPLMLSFKGEELKLSAGEENDSLPLLNNNNNQKNEEKMDYKTIALKLGLLETAGENEILSSIELLLGYKTANQQLQQEKEQLQLSAITQTVKEATAKHLILAEKETHFIELGKKVGIDSLKLTFDSMTPIQKPLNLINTTGGGSSMSLDWKKLSDVPVDKMEELRNNDKTTYMKLYKAEYGVDCPKY